MHAARWERPAWIVTRTGRTTAPWQAVAGAVPPPPAPMVRCACGVSANATHPRARGAARGTSACHVPCKPAVCKGACALPVMTPVQTGAVWRESASVAMDLRAAWGVLVCLATAYAMRIHVPAVVMDGSATWRLPWHVDCQGVNAWLVTHSAPMHAAPMGNASAGRDLPVRRDRRAWTGNASATPRHARDAARTTSAVMAGVTRSAVWRA